MTLARRINPSNDWQRPGSTLAPGESNGASRPGAHCRIHANDDNYLRDYLRSEAKVQHESFGIPYADALESATRWFHMQEAAHARDVRRAKRSIENGGAASASSGGGATTAPAPGTGETPANPRPSVQKCGSRQTATVLSAARR